MRALRSRGKLGQRIAKFAAFTVLVAGLSCGKDKETAPGDAGAASSATVQADAAPKAPAPKGAGGKSSPKEKQHEPKKDTGCPEEMARVEDFCIDRWEIHLVNMDDGKRHPENKAPTKAELKRLTAVSKPWVYPQGHLSRQSLRAACRHAEDEGAKKRLCDVEEWDRACRGPDGYRYPYGNDYKKGACNVGKTDFGPGGMIKEICVGDDDKPVPCTKHILNLLFPDIPHRQRTGKHFNDPRILREPGYHAMTGEYRLCVTPDGIYDMAGGLSEWTKSVDKERTDSYKGKERGRSIRIAIGAGDAFSGTGIQGCGRRVVGHPDDYFDYAMGGRCCMDAR